MKTGISSRDRRENLRKLCVRATELLEDMHEPVTCGQGPNFSANGYREVARELRTVARDLVSMADRIESNLESSSRPKPARKKVRVRAAVGGSRKS